MKTRSLFLIVLIACIAPRSPALGQSASPESVASQYWTAIQHHDYQSAYALVDSETKATVSAEEFARDGSAIVQQLRKTGDVSARLLYSDKTHAECAVHIMYLWKRGGESVHATRLTMLDREGDAWRVSNPSGIYKRGDTPGPWSGALNVLYRYLMTPGGKVLLSHGGRKLNKVEAQHEPALGPSEAESKAEWHFVDAAVTDIHRDQSLDVDVAFADGSSYLVMRVIKIKGRWYIDEDKEVAQLSSPSDMDYRYVNGQAKLVWTPYGVVPAAIACRYAWLRRRAPNNGESL